MDSSTFHRLNELNQRFYRITGVQFNQSRQQPWPGWTRLLGYLETPLSVLDVGCGNGRFGLFLRQNLDGPIAYHGIDSDATLLDFARQSLEGVLASVRLTRLDVLQEPFPDDVYSLVALFGVIHHIPGFETRRWLIQQLSTLVAPGGLLVFASWCFFEQPRFRQRIVPWPDDFVIERHDYLLDWRLGAHALRYCHYVDDAEHGQLLSTSGLTLVDTYRADGKDGTLNHYAILQRPSSVEEPQN